MTNAVSSDVLIVINAYPTLMRKKLLIIRALIFETANELIKDGVITGAIEETLKWGEPAYLCKTGSTIRFDRLKSSTDNYALYFNCKTTLVETFKELYSDQFTFSANRAIVFSVKDKIPVDALKHCIALSLTYHKVKHLPLLGA